ncbi:MAG: metallophosphoesterase [Candidatus Taylorbacteria bacterium]|nr:metallophosphoesterase [Candidatus Taylorbacteria bacterium]
MKNPFYRFIQYFLFLAFLALVAFFIIQYTNEQAVKNNQANQPFPPVPFVVNVPTFSFTAAGDYGMNKSTEGVMSLIRGINPNFHLALGDMIYSSDVKYSVDWCVFAKKFLGTIPIELLAGNHDTTDGDYNKLINCLPNSLPNDLYFKGEYGKEYYFDYPANNPMARFILLSPDLKFQDNPLPYEYNSTSSRYTWLNDRFNTPHTKGYPWVIILMHKLCISAGDKTCEIGKDLPRLLIKQKADLVINGHDHIYARTNQIKCLKDDFDPECITESITGDNYKQGSGTVFLTAGTGGQTGGLLEEGKNSKDIPYFKVIYGSDNKNSEFGVLSVRVTNKNLYGDFIGVDGKVLDSFTISR